MTRREGLCGDWPSYRPGALYPFGVRETSCRRSDALALPPGMNKLSGCAVWSPSVRNRGPRVGPWGEAMIDYPTECAEGTLVDAGLRRTTGCGSPELALY